MQRTSKAKSSVLSYLSGLENVLFNDFIDDELDSEDVSELSASASCICVRENLYLHFLNFVWVCACNCDQTVLQQGRRIAVDGRLE